MDPRTPFLRLLALFGPWISPILLRMAANPVLTPNVQYAVPFFMVADMSLSLRFYTEGLGFALKNQWVVDGKLRWCWLTLGGASLMLQEYNPGHIPPEKRGLGVSIWFQCLDSVALYREFQSRGLTPQEPFVGNNMWDTKIVDPDGYNLHFESPTTVSEETKLSDLPPGAAL
ncbi:MAG TPA: VOC family protein [Candidatus Acidoferrum sp.]|nr:VOC family protein [Candidatus Acidoferrum sp.]